MWDEITYPFPNFNGCTVEVWEWINNFIPHFIMDVITYPCWVTVKTTLGMSFRWSRIWPLFKYWPQDHLDGLETDCSISIANTLEILQSCTKSSILSYVFFQYNLAGLWLNHTSSIKIALFLSADRFLLLVTLCLFQWYVYLVWVVLYVAFLSRKWC